MKKCIENQEISIHRGILINLIYVISLLQKKLVKKNLIINNKKYRDIIKKIYPNISINKKNDNEKYYFNIRKITKKQDYIIDYLENYKKINAKSVFLVPWSDPIDPLIIFKYNEKYNINSDIIKNQIQIFNCNQRNNYKNKNDIWDNYIEIYMLENIIKYTDNKKLENIINDKKYIIYTNLHKLLQKSCDKSYNSLNNELYFQAEPYTVVAYEKYEKKNPDLTNKEVINNIKHKYNEIIIKLTQNYIKKINQDNIEDLKNTKLVSQNDIEELIKIMNEKIRYINNIKN